MDETSMNNQERVLFYIYAPPYRSNSAGIRVLYMLCDGLNKDQVNAWIVLSNPNEASEMHDLDCPILDFQTLKNNMEITSKVVVIYSETVVGNPLSATNVIRYYLNYPGALGGTSKFRHDEIKIAYSENIGKTLTGNFEILFIPAVDPKSLPEKVEKSDLSLVYAGKYRAFRGRPEAAYEAPWLEIFRDGPNKQTRQEVLRLLSVAKQIYVWENSTIATEAILLGAPVIFMENDFLGKIIAEKELGHYGYTLKCDKESIDTARKELNLATQKYMEAWLKYPKDIDKFKNRVINEASNLGSQKSLLKIPRKGIYLNLHRLRMFISITRHSGILRALRVTREFGHFQIRKRSKNT